VRRAALVVIFLLVGCETDRSVALELRFADRPHGVEAAVPVRADGRVAVEVRACAPGLSSGAAVLSSSRVLADGGVASESLVLVSEGAPSEGCASREGWLRRSTFVDVPDEGELVLEAAALGERVVAREALVREQTADIASVTPGRPIPAGGGVVTMTILTRGAADGTRVFVRTVPPISLSTARPTTLSNTATVEMSVPEAIAEVWFEARLAHGAPMDTLVTRGASGDDG